MFEEKIVIGIDQSFTSTAVVAALPEGSILFEVYKTTKDDNEKFDRIFRARTIAEDVTDYISRIQSNNPMCDIEINIEGLSMGSSGKMAAANRDLAGLYYIIMDRMVEAGFENIIDVVAPTSLKKFATGKGNAKKESLLEYLEPHNKLVYDKFMTIPKSKGRMDLVDAYWLSQWRRGE